MQPPIVLVDMDGVLADFHAGTLKYVNANYPDVLTPDFKHYRVHENFSDSAVRSDIIAMHSRPGFFRNLPLIDGAVQGWQKIIDLGYQPRICSSPLSTNPVCEIEKRQWLEEHFGTAVAVDALITKDKYLHPAIALIDDRTDLLRADTAVWQQILFNAPYNQSFETDFRLSRWSDSSALAELLERAADLATR